MSYIFSHRHHTCVPRLHQGIVSSISSQIHLPRSLLPIEFRVKVAMIGNSLRATIPKPVADGIGLKKGDTLILTVSDDEIRIRKANRGNKQD
jgi:AbrB family looped-hinge helix DNA binding protein